MAASDKSVEPLYLKTARRPESSQTHHKLISAAFGSCITSFLSILYPLLRSYIIKVTPFDVIKTRLQSSSTSITQSNIGFAKFIVRNEGARALWQGLVPTLLVSEELSY